MTPKLTDRRRINFEKLLSEITRLAQEAQTEQRVRPQATKGKIKTKTETRS